MGSQFHVIGAGMAGLAAAVDLALSGRKVTLYEAAGHAGGRARSYFDTELGCRVDNGNHLLLSGNKAALAYIDRIGAADTLTGPGAPRFDFLDLTTDERWTLAPGPGLFPWWIFDAGRRVAGTVPADYLKLAAFLGAGEDDTVAALFDTKTPLFRRLLQPLVVAALNTEVENASARLMGRILRDTFGRGGAAIHPLVPAIGLSETLVDPALSTLAQAGATIRLGSCLRRIDFEEEYVARLHFDETVIELARDDEVILAVPVPVALRLLPGLTAPVEYRAIINAHYRLDQPIEGPPFIGLVGGVAEWVFRKPGILSVTISAADPLIDRSAEELAARIWEDVRWAYGLADREMPPCRIVKEKRATFAATPEQLPLRPPAETLWRNLSLAGDWTDTGLPSTIEGAIRSGNEAARTSIGRISQGRGGRL